MVEVGVGAGMVIWAGATVNPAAVPVMLIRSVNSVMSSLAMVIAKFPLPFKLRAGMVMEASGLVIRKSAEVAILPGPGPPISKAMRVSAGRVAEPFSRAVTVTELDCPSRKLLGLTERVTRLGWTSLSVIVSVAGVTENWECVPASSRVSFPS